MSTDLDAVEKRRKARVLFWLLWGLMVLVTVSEAFNCLVLPQNLTRWLTILLVMNGSCLGFLVLNRRGHTRLASCLLLGLLLALVFKLAWNGGGIRAAIIYEFPLVTLIAGLLLNWRVGIIVGLMSVLGELGLALAEMHGSLPVSVVQHTPLSLWMSSAECFALLLLLQYLAVERVNQALKATREELVQRQQAEAALRDSEAFRKRIFEGSRVPIVVMDAVTHQFVDCNPAAAKIYCHASCLETLGKTPADVSAPEQYNGLPSPPQVQAFVARALAEGTTVFEWRHQRPDGEIWDAEVCLMSFQSGDRQLLQFTLQDITERRQTQADLREQALLLAASHDAIIVWDFSHGIKYLNPAAEKLTGKTLAEARAQPLPVVFRTRSEPVLNTAMQEVASRGEWTGELTMLSSEGRARDIAARWIALTDASGKLGSVLITCNDITEQKQLQAQYLRAQRLESIGTLASGVAHDLNNILSPILMGVDLLEMAVQDAELRDTVAMMKESAQRGSDTVKQLLTFARGADTLKGPVQPRHLLKEITRLIQQTFPKNIQIYSDFTGQPAIVLADPSQLHQVFMNLCVNARDAMPEGGMLFLRLENITLDSSTAKAQPKARPIPYVVFTIADSGSGIPPDIIERIFDPFFTTKSQGKGTGLGLSTVLGIVENHDGFVKVESTVAKGSTFQVFIPASASTSEVAAAGEPPKTPQGRGECVLVVDDEPALLKMIQSILRKGGYTTLSAAKASEAVHLYERNHDRIQAVLTDVMMPFGDGRQLITMLYEQDPKLPIIAMSGMSSTEFQHDLKQRGACQFLTKPFTAEELLTCLAQALHLLEGVTASRLV